MYEQARYALRSILRHKRFAAVAVFTLGLAIGLNTTMYGVIDALLFPAVRLYRPEQLYRIIYYSYTPKRVDAQALWAAIRDTSAYASGVAGYSMRSSFAERGLIAHQATVALVDGNYFDVARPTVIKGRGLTADDARLRTHAAVLSYRMWRTLFPEGELPSSASVLLDGVGYAVVGVLAENAADNSWMDVWTSSEASEGIAMFAIVRLRDGVSAVAAERDLAVIAERIALQSGIARNSVVFRLAGPLKPHGFRIRSFYVLMIAAVLAVLIVACANLANLQLARGLGRSRELATRAALGASRRALITLLLWESAWLAAGGVVVGVLLTIWGVRVAGSLIPPDVAADLVATPQVSWRMLAAGVAITGLCVLLVGLFPAIRLSGVNLNDALKSGMGTGTNKKGRRQYAILVAGEISVSLAVVATAMTLGSIAFRVHHYDFGYDPFKLVWAGVPVDSGGAATWDQLMANAASRARSLDDVANAATYRLIHLGRNTLTVDASGGARAEHFLPIGAEPIVASAEFFRTFNVPIVRGHDFPAAGSAAPVAVVNEIAARAWWPGADPIGRMIKLGPDTSRAPWVRVIGVSEHLWMSDLENLLDDPWAPRVVVLAVPNASIPVNTAGGVVNVIMRTNGSAERLVLASHRLFAPSVRRPRYYRIFAERWSSYTRLESIMKRQDFLTSLFTTLALLTLGLAMFGIYAVIAHSVAQRSRELGVRIALGASARDILHLVLREGNAVALAGVAVGLLLATQGLNALSMVLLGEDPTNVTLLVVVAAAVFAASFLAAVVPALRATRVDPVQSLRSD